jgi:hypothetical protein
MYLQKSSISSLSNHPPLVPALTSFSLPYPLLVLSAATSSPNSSPPMVSPSSLSPSNAPEKPVQENVRLEKRRCVLGGRRSDDPREEKNRVVSEKI